MQLRALMDALDASKAWDLRCYVREKLIQFIQQKYPESLPRSRAEIRAMEMINNGSVGLTGKDAANTLPVSSK